MSTLFSAIEWPFGVAAATAVGAGVAPVITPEVQDIINAVWTDAANNDRSRPPAVGTLAGGVAQGQVTDAAARTWAKRAGFGDAEFTALVAVANTGPGVAQAFDLWRRGKIDVGGFRRAAKRAALEEEWIDALVQLKEHVLTPDVLAAAIVRGLIPDPGILPVSPPTGTGKVPSFPVFNVDAIAEAEGSGYDREHLSVLVGNYGRPMAPEAAAHAVFKGIIERVDYDRAVSEGDVRNEWRDAIFENNRFILSPQDAAGLQLRGWIDEAERNRLGAKHGASPETMQGLYLNRGRPATVRQVHIGYARGAHHPDYPNDERGAALRAVQQSDIRTEWFELEYAARYSLPSPFVLRSLVQSGALTEAEGEDVLIQSGWPPTLAQKVATFWANTVTTEARPWVKRAASQLWTATHKAFMRGQIDEAGARASLGSIPVPDAEVAGVLARWNAEKDVAGAVLTPAEIRREYRRNVISEAEALAELQEHGYTAEDARRYLSGL